MACTSEISAWDDLLFIGADRTGERIFPEVAGSKAANLSRIAKLGLNVPPAFVLSTRLCAPVNSGAHYIKAALGEMLCKGTKYLEQASGRKFGDARCPLFLSVRSGAARSMPGMMASLLNVGMNDETVRGLLRLTGNPRLAWDCYRRFVQGYSEVIGGADPQSFANRLADIVRAERVLNETELDPEALERLTLEYIELAGELLGRPIPSDPMKQLEEATYAVYGSWQSPKAREYRRLNKLEQLAGTAVTFQAMIFGNAGGNSGAGVAFTRNPATGEKGLYAEFLFDAQGEDVVSGRRLPGGIALLKERMPEIASTLNSGAARLECEFQDMQDIEFTVEEGQLYFLQTRSAKRTPRAALRVLIDLVEEGVIDEAEGAKRASEIDLEATAVTHFHGRADAIVRGTPASAGVASGRAVFDRDRAAARAKSGEPVILIRPDTSTEDIAGIAVAEGILTAIGGRTAHAAVVARQLGKVCVVGCDRLAVDGAKRFATICGRTIKEGDWLSLDADTGEVFLGKREIVVDRPHGAIQVVSRWMANAGLAPKTLKTR